jgi:hypothetical protein
VDSVADRLREDDRRALAAMSPEARVRLALVLGARDLDTFRLSQDPPLGRAAASRLLRRQRQAGRRPSRSMTSLTE